MIFASLLYHLPDPTFHLFPQVQSVAYSKVFRSDANETFALCRSGSIWRGTVDYPCYFSSSAQPYAWLSYLTFIFTSQIIRARTL